MRAMALEPLSAARSPPFSLGRTTVRSPRRPACDRSRCDRHASLSSAASFLAREGRAKARAFVGSTSLPPFRSARFLVLLPPSLFLTAAPPAVPSSPRKKSRTLSACSPFRPIASSRAPSTVRLSCSSALRPLIAALAAPRSGPRSPARPTGTWPKRARASSAGHPSLTPLSLPHSPSRPLLSSRPVPLHRRSPSSQLDPPARPPCQLPTRLKTRPRSAPSPAASSARRPSPARATSSATSASTRESGALRSLSSALPCSPSRALR